MSAKLDAEVRVRANHRCEYCLFPQAAFKRSFHIEHIVARQHGGPTHSDNLALACWYCNFKKGANLSGIDPETGQLVPLFNPRQHAWRDHFLAMMPALTQPAITPRTSGITMVGRTPTGRATVYVLGMNDPFRCQLRLSLAQEGLYVAPPE